MKTIKDRPHFPDVSSIFDLLAKPRSPGAGDSSENPVRTGFHGTGGTYEAAQEWLRHGWPEGVEMAERETERLNISRPHGRRVRWVNDIAGAYPNVPAHLAGQPDRMFSMRERDNQAGGWRNVELCIPVSFNCNVKFDTALKRGVAYVALVDALEQARVRCKVTCGFPGEVRGKRYGMTFAVKDYKQPLMLNDLAFMVGHPTMLRRIMFGIMERSTDEDVVDSTQGGYGRSVDPIPEYDYPNADENAVVFSTLHSNTTWTVEQHLQYLIGQLPEALKGVFNK